MLPAIKEKELRLKALKLRKNIVEMIGVGKAGHLGGSSSIADIVSVLYFGEMRIDPRNPKDPDRDRFLLSKGHAVLAQYAALAEMEYFPKSEFAKLKALGGILQGHPDMDETPGIEAVTGSLGQGLSIACGLAMGLRLDTRPSRVFVVLGDGELSEGQIWEAAMAAAKFKIDNLTAILDYNGIQATGPTEEIFPIPDVPAKWAAFGWHVIEIDGHDISAIHSALQEAKDVTGKPAIIIARTVKGKGVSFAEHQAAFHNGTLTQEQYDQAIRELDSQMSEVEQNG